MKIRYTIKGIRHPQLTVFSKDKLDITVHEDMNKLSVRRGKLRGKFIYISDLKKKKSDLLIKINNKEKTLKNRTIKRIIQKILSIFRLNRNYEIESNYDLYQQEYKEWKEKKKKKKLDNIKLAGIVTLYNPDMEVKNSINSYIDDLDILYVIDNSDNENKDVLPDNKKIVYLPNHTNIGVATALNIGAEKAIIDGYKWLLTMDQDSCFDKDSVNKMKEYIEYEYSSDIGLITPWHKINTDVIEPDSFIDHPLEVMTSGNIINLEAYTKINGFKDEYFIDDIDIEYCMNLNKNGYHIDRLNYIFLKHDLGDIKVKRVLGKNFVCSNHNYIRRYYMARNTYYLCDAYKDIYPEYCKFLKRGLRGQAKNIILFEKDKIRKIKNMYRGYKDYKKGTTGKYPYN